MRVKRQFLKNPRSRITFESLNSKPNSNEFDLRDFWKIYRVVTSVCVRLPKFSKLQSVNAVWFRHWMFWKTPNRNQRCFGLEEKNFGTKKVKIEKWLFFSRVKKLSKLKCDFFFPKNLPSQINYGFGFEFVGQILEKKWNQNCTFQSAGHACAWGRRNPDF